MFPTANMDKTSRDRYAQQNVWASVVAEVVKFRADAKGRDIAESDNIARQMMKDLTGYAIECKMDEPENIALEKRIWEIGYKAYDEITKKDDDLMFMLMSKKMKIAGLTHSDEFSFEPKGTWESISEQTRKE